MKSLVDDVTDVDPIGGKLMYTMLYENVNAHPILHYYGTEAAQDGKYFTLDAINYSKGDK